MRPETLASVNASWADLLGLEHHELWVETTVNPHRGSLVGYPGWFVAWTDRAVHVSVPDPVDAGAFDLVEQADPEQLRSRRFWSDLAISTGNHLIGPAVHHYVDEDPGLPEAVEQIDPIRVRLLRDHVTDAEWEESGVEDVDDAIALARWGEPGRAPRPWVPTLQGVAVLRQHAGAARDVAVLVAGDIRRTGVGTALGAAATSYAVNWHGWCRWRAHVDNAGSQRIAASLGFEPYATQLAIHP